MEYYCGKCGTEFSAGEARETLGLCPFCAVPLDSTAPPPPEPRRSGATTAGSAATPR